MHTKRRFLCAVQLTEFSDAKRICELLKESKLVKNAEDLQMTEVCLHIFFASHLLAHSRIQLVSNSISGRFAVYRPATTPLDRATVLCGVITDDDTPHPSIIPELQELPIISISIGDAHSAALTIDGRVFTWGRNDQGALGLNTIDGWGPGGYVIMSDPKRTPFFGPEGMFCVSVSANGRHTCALAIDLEVRIDEIALN